MENAILNKLARLDELARDIDLGLWAGRFSDPDFAYAALSSVVAKAERCRRVLKFRYGLDVA